MRGRNATQSEGSHREQMDKRSPLPGALLLGPMEVGHHPGSVDGLVGGRLAERLREQEATGQEVVLGLALDALGDDLRVEGPPSSRSACTSGGIRSGLADRLDERAVDLEEVDRELPQVARRGQ